MQVSKKESVPAETKGTEKESDVKEPTLDNEPTVIEPPVIEPPVIKPQNIRIVNNINIESQKEVISEVRKEIKQ